VRFGHSRNPKQKTHAHTVPCASSRAVAKREIASLITFLPMSPSCQHPTKSPRKLLASTRAQFQATLGPKSCCVAMPLVCSDCKDEKGKKHFTAGQWKKPDGERKCRECCDAAHKASCLHISSQLVCICSDLCAAVGCSRRKVVAFLRGELSKRSAGVQKGASP
jgi:hypothetical protein